MHRQIAIGKNVNNVGVEMVADFEKSVNDRGLFEVGELQPAREQTWATLGGCEETPSVLRRSS